jgi:membrane protease YdiL (CAAX protease family)
VNTSSTPEPGQPPVLTVPSTEPGPVNRWRWGIHLILVTGYLLVVGLSRWSERSTWDPALSHTPGGLMRACAFGLALFGLVFALAWLTSRASSDDLLLRWRGKFWPVPLGIGYSIVLRFSLLLVVMAVNITLLMTRLVSMETLRYYIRNHPPNVEVLVDTKAMQNNPVYFWLVLTVVSFVVAGLREELWRSAFLAGLRKLWPKYFESRAGQIGAVAIAAVVFGFGHLAMGPIAVGAAAVLGFGLGLIMVLHRSIWPAVIAHGTFDATTLALLPWATEMLKHLRQISGQ